MERVIDGRVIDGPVTEELPRAARRDSRLFKGRGSTEFMAPNLLRILPPEPGKTAQRMNSPHFTAPARGRGGGR
jgi:hypothetical protein